MGKFVNAILILTVIIFFSITIFIFVMEYRYPSSVHNFTKQWLVLFLVGILALIVLIKRRRKIADSSENSKM